jgi:PAT family beta-lactamase induction signal transducer AmpG
MAWPTVCRIVAVGMSAGLLGALFAIEPMVVERPRSLHEGVGRPLRDLLTRPGGWLILVFVLVFKLPENLANAMSLPFLRHLQFTDDQIGAIRQGLGVAVTILGALVGGLLVRRWGIWRSLWIFGVLHSVSNLAFLALARIGPRYDALVAVIVIENLCVGLTTAGFIAWMIGQCDSRFSAFQFALLSGMMALGRVGATPISGWMADALGWPCFFAVSALCGLPGLMLLPWLQRDPHTPSAAPARDLLAIELQPN